MTKRKQDQIEGYDPWEIEVAYVVPLVLFSGYFVYSARREEKIMIAQFPEQYPAYMRRTRMLLPFAF
ncbi:MAG: hypothetical protein WCD69_12265 [Xanthobacteraceae bacterium]